MKRKEIWKRIQQAMGYTDKEIEILRNSPHRCKAIEAGPELVRTKIIAEVIEAKNCAAHDVGTRYVMRGNGVVETKACSDRLCIDVFPLLVPFHHRVFDRITEGMDVEGMEAFVHCPDTGVECGGFGKATLRLYIEQS